MDDGELRSYEDRESRLFLSTVMMGRIPAELVQMAEGGEVHVDMEDHKTEEYSRPRGVRPRYPSSPYDLLFRRRY